jgi:hypothetical protein
MSVSDEIHLAMARPVFDALRTAAKVRPGTVHEGVGVNEEVKGKRRKLVEKAVVGDLVVAIIGGSKDPAVDWQIRSIEQVSEHTDAAEIVQRWKDLGIIDGLGRYEIWEGRAGGYFRKRTGR